VLAVGDEGFTHKCLDKFADFKRRGKTVLLVTHSLNLVERFCDEAAWLDGGRMRAEGDPYRVIADYVSDVEKQEERFLASSDDKARHVVEAAAAPAQPAVDLPPDPTADMMRAARRPLGLARRRDCRCRAGRCAGAAGSRHSFRRSRDAAHDRARASAGR
jgi:ABC-type glutathione transport system ATPase component